MRSPELRHSAAITADQLSAASDLVMFRGIVSGGFAVRGPWISQATLSNPFKLIAVLSGHARLTADGADPVDLEPGDVAVLNNRSRLTLEGGLGVSGLRREIVPEADDQSLRRYGSRSSVDADEDVVVGGHIELDPAGQALLEHALPTLGRIAASADGSGTLRASLDRLFAELAEPRTGSAFAIQQYGQLLVFEILRAFVERVDLPAGWLRLLGDEALRPALRLMHTEPGRHWRLAGLAHAAAMSRTSFAEHFRAVAGVPPLTYLTRWRMLVAQRALRDRDTPVTALASELGYTSQSAFSTAFKRHTGESPQSYRSRARADQLAAASTGTSAAVS